MQLATVTPVRRTNTRTANIQVITLKEIGEGL